MLVPVFNEEEAIPDFLSETLSILEGLALPFEIVFVNDGSTDATLDTLLTRARADARIKVIDLSRNFGKEAALTAALDYASGEAVIPIDADLQDPPELIPKMLAKWREGCEVVLMRRADRSSDSFLKRATARLFYRFHDRISRVGLPEDVGDFRLMDRRVVEAIKGLREQNRFMKGIFAWAGFRTCVVPYTRRARARGKSKFNGWRLWKFAVEGITSFSTAPLTIWLYVGGFISACAFAYGLFIFFRTLIFGIELPGYASQLCLTLLFGGLQLLGIGILGEYVGRTYIESKNRPVYVVREVFEK
ncbi:MAG: glycosyltransferase family 2 protein [Synergistaceae bacterium]|jgi:glycosyltransferase involved in cell wall biosynthesis|nr:glycosyltransferase family 2 protein [Synergistaceae bacterium]